eukprot:CAMPEP_0118910102 /NCGR_PEP_ID=MMETSP1166-20130328/12391_1 /TAXON_ID=1104430 /ORGANISM="Chrysoreinhardia sp, Strain CCMP3193" /LENGTH=522 /DNA_ID=CAMNT_0006849557 /DNA_START=12 /DNA_END=1580 /DNA_ORIENTATION=-
MGATQSLLVLLVPTLPRALHLRSARTPRDGLYLGIQRRPEAVSAVVCDPSLDVVHRCQVEVHGDDDETLAARLREALEGTARHVTHVRGPRELFFVPRRGDADADADDDASTTRRRRRYGPLTFFEASPDSDEAIGRGLVEGEAFVAFGEADAFLRREAPKVVYANGDVARKSLYPPDFDDAVARAPPGNDGLLGVDVVVPELRPRISRSGQRFHARRTRRQRRHPWADDEERRHFPALVDRVDLALARHLFDTDLGPHLARAHIETRLLSMRGAAARERGGDHSFPEGTQSGVVFGGRVYVAARETSRSRAQLVADVFGADVAGLPEEPDAVALGRAYRAAAADLLVGSSTTGERKSSFSEFLATNGRAASGNCWRTLATPREPLHRDVYHDDLVRDVIALERSIEREQSESESELPNEEERRHDVDEERRRDDPRLSEEEDAAEEDGSPPPLIFLPSQSARSATKKGALLSDLDDAKGVPSLLREDDVTTDDLVLLSEDEEDVRSFLAAVEARDDSTEFP